MTKIALLFLVAFLGVAHADPMNANVNTYALASSASSSAVTLLPQDAAQTRVIVSNPTAYGAFIVFGKTSAPTAALPTSATVPSSGSFVPAGAIMTLSKNASDGYVSAISTAADAGKYIYFQFGAGE